MRFYPGSRSASRGSSQPKRRADTRAVEPTLSALLAGTLDGLGLVALLGAYGSDDRLYLDPRTRTVIRR